MPRLLVSAGEPSGDLYASELVRHLRDAHPGLDVFGLGGDRLAANGGRLLAHVRDLAVVGLAEVLRHLPRLRGVFRAVLAEVDQRPPDLAILVDYPGFNLRLARQLRARTVPVVYYVSPQVWAWRGGRIRTLRDTVALMLVIFPFEEEIYRRAGVPVAFVGHPLVDLVPPAPPADEARRGLGLDPARPVVALLPGSRRKEVDHHLPRLLESVRRLGAARPDLQFALAAAPGLDAASLRASVAALPVTVFSERTHDVLASATAAVVASGTATVEAALLGTPMVVVYRLSPVTYTLGRRLVRVPHVAMANLIAGERLVTELVQGDFTPEAVVREVLSLLDDDERRRHVQAGLAEVRRRLGGGGASARAAKEVDALLGQVLAARAS
jgi:lipid-A-disaccharide synthase